MEDLRLADLDLAGRKLVVRQGKGRKDRAVFLADSAISALNAYLAVRRSGPSDHVFLYRAEPVHKDLLRRRPPSRPGAGAEHEGRPGKAPGGCRRQARSPGRQAR